jgi:hypothetical protein
LLQEVAIPDRVGDTPTERLERLLEVVQGERCQGCIEDELPDDKAPLGERSPFYVAELGLLQGERGFLLRQRRLRHRFVVLQISEGFA